MNSLKFWQCCFLLIFQFNQAVGDQIMAFVKVSLGIIDMSVCLTCINEFPTALAQRCRILHCSWFTLAPATSVWGFWEAESTLWCSVRGQNWEDGL